MKGSLFAKNQLGHKELIAVVVVSFLSAHFMEMLGHEESLFEILRESYYYKDVGSGTVLAVIAFTLVLTTTLLLNRGVPWSDQFFKRLLLQFAFGICIPAAVLYYGIYLQGILIAKDSVFFTPTFLIYEFPVIIMLLFVGNLLCVFYLFYKQHIDLPEKNRLETATETNIDTAQTKPRKIIITNKGYRNFPVPVEKIAYIYREGEINYLLTFDNNEYQVDSSLDHLYEMLNKNAFFRANRQTIINIYACSYYSQAENGKLQIFLTPPKLNSIIISQKTAPHFKNWLKN